jgi:hypothetical protein
MSPLGFEHDGLLIVFSPELLPGIVPNVLCMVLLWEAVGQEWLYLIICSMALVVMVAV